MKKIYLVAPAQEHKEMVLAYKKEHMDNQEKHLHGSSLLDSYDNYEDWLTLLKNNQNIETLPEGWVVSSTFLVLNETKDMVIGMVDIRHSLNEMLRSFGGHIGYGVRPSCRRQGYATQILKEALTFCKSIGLNQVMVACDVANVGSSKTILKCGGILEKETTFEGKDILIYWNEV